MMKNFGHNIPEHCRVAFLAGHQHNTAEVERLRGENQALREALQKIADLAIKTALSSISADYVKPILIIVGIAKQALNPKP